MSALPTAQRPRFQSFLLTVALAAIVATATVAVFAPAIGAEFVRVDDPELVIDNPNFRGLTGEHLRWMFSNTLLGHYQPLTWLSYCLDDALWGLDAHGQPVAAGYHLTNVLIHAVNGVLVFLLIRWLIGRGGNALRVDLAAAAGALVFSLHPLRVESVAWVTERRDVLSTMFLLAAALAYLRFAGDASRKWAWYAVAVALLLASLLSKAWGMSFFVVLLVLDVHPLRRLTLAGLRTRGGLSVVLEKMPFLLLGIGAAAIAGSAQRSAIAAKTLAEWGVKERAAQAVYGLAFYIRTMLWPRDLSPFYPMPAGVDLSESRYVLATIIVVCLGMAALLARRRAPWIAAALVVYAACIAPVLGVFQSGDQFVADRYSYVACIPFAVLAAAGIRALAVRSGSAGLRALLVTTCVAALVTLGVLTWRQTLIWRNTESLWTHAIRVEPCAASYTALGIELERLGRKGEAAQNYQSALRLDNHDGRAWFCLGNILKEAGKWPEAAAALTEAARTMRQSYMAWVNLGGVYDRMGQSEDALKAYRAAVADIERDIAVGGERRQISAMPYLALGRALAKAGDTAGARENFKKALAYPETRALAEKELAALTAPKLP